jgi:hypothetical protein
MSKKSRTGISGHSCMGKYRHQTPDAARKQLYSLLGSGKADQRSRKRLGVYHCRDCQGWHVGNNSAT